MGSCDGDTRRSILRRDSAKFSGPAKKARRTDRRRGPRYLRPGVAGRANESRLHHRADLRPPAPGKSSAFAWRISRMPGFESDTRGVSLDRLKAPKTEAERRVPPHSDGPHSSSRACRDESLWAGTGSPLFSSILAHAIGHGGTISSGAASRTLSLGMHSATSTQPRRGRSAEPRSLHGERVVLACIHLGICTPLGSPTRYARNGDEDNGAF